MSNVYPFNPLNLGQPTYNPYLPQQQYNPIAQPIPQITGPHMEIGRVDSKEAIYSIPMGPNSSALFADNNLSKIWMVTTDPSGFKKITGLSYTVDSDDLPPMKQAQNVEDPFDKINRRLDSLEERMSSYGQPNYKHAYANKPGNGANRPNNRGGSDSQESGNVD